MDPYNNFQGMPGGKSGAMPYMNQAINEVKGYYDPFTQYGAAPEEFVNKIYSSFKDSPVFQRERDERLKGLTSAAAASGRINNPAYEREYGDLGGSMMSDQMRRYFQDVMGERGLGLQAAQGAAGDVGNLYNQAGGLEFQREQQQKQNQYDMWRSLIGGAGTAVGGALGGPLGTMAGNWFSNLFNNNSGGNQNQGYQSPQLNANNYSYGAPVFNASV